MSAPHPRGHMAKPLVALALLVGAWAWARPSQLTDETRAAMARRFRFEEHVLALPSDAPRASTRAVHPSLAHMAGWISAVGGAIALNDLDADGLSNDLCTVDTTTNRVVVLPAPGTGQRYAPFSLEPEGLRYERESMAPMGCVPADLNEDGRMDVIVYYWGRPPVAFFKRTPPAAPLTARSYLARELATSAERWHTNALTVADVDGDGHQDILVGNYFADGARVLERAADGTEHMQDSMSRAYNGGRNRILRWVAARGGDEPGATFEEVALGPPGPTASMWTLALGAADLDGDLLPEIYIGNDFGPDMLLHNRSRAGEIVLVPVRGKRALTTPRSNVLGGDSFKGMGVDFADLDGDGSLDIHVSNISTEYGLMESNLLFMGTGDGAAFGRGRAPYSDGGERFGLARSGWTWDVRFGDFDNDGTFEVLHATGFLAGEINRWPELHEAAMGNDQLLKSPLAWHRFGVGDDLSGHAHDPFFVRGPDGRYRDLAAAIGIAREGVSRGIATGDVDADGALDFAVGHQWEESRFFRNTAPTTGAFLALALRHPLGDDGDGVLRVERGHPGVAIPAGVLTRPATGAVARVELPDGSQAIAFVDGGNGHSGARAPELHFGLGSAPDKQILAVHLDWRSPQGETLSATLELTPGWHTVLLGRAAEDEQ